MTDYFADALAEQDPVANLVIAIAKAMYAPDPNLEVVCPPAWPQTPWEDLEPYARHHFIRLAATAVATIEAAGWTLVLSPG